MWPLGIAIFEALGSPSYGYNYYLGGDSSKPGHELYRNKRVGEVMVPARTVLLADGGATAAEEEGAGDLERGAEVLHACQHPGGRAQLWRIRRNSVRPEGSQRPPRWKGNCRFRGQARKGAPRGELLHPAWPNHSRHDRSRALALFRSEHGQFGMNSSSIARTRE